MRGCIERMFLFDLDPRLRQIFARDAQVGATPVSASGVYNRRSVNTRVQGTGLKQMHPLSKSIVNFRWILQTSEPNAVGGK